LGFGKPSQKSFISNFKKSLIPFFGEISPVKRKGCWGKYPPLTGSLLSGVLKNPGLDSRLWTLDPPKATQAIEEAIDQR
jgi:hypothetical protein